MKSFNELGFMINTELKEILEEKVEGLKQKAIDAHPNDVGEYEHKVEIKGGTGNRSYIQISFWGQCMWTDEFGKGMGIGIYDLNGSGLLGNLTDLFDSKHREIPLNYQRAHFKRSIYWKQYTLKNPYRKGGTYSNVLITDDNGRAIKKRQKITVTRNGKEYTQYRKMRQYRRERDPNREVRIYSRPGGYTDIDGNPQSSDVKGVFPIESQRRLASGKPQVSHPGSLRISDALGYNFIDNKQKSPLLRQKEADKISDKIANEVEKYLHDLF